LVIEHTFVTTLDSHDALALASDMLSRRGFVTEGESGFQLGEEWTTLQMKRGKKSAARAKTPSECPQQVRLEWDRGRVTLAASIEPQSRRNRTFAFGGVIGYGLYAMRNKRATAEATDMMMVISTSLENLLVQNLPAEEAGKAWFAQEDLQLEKARKARVRSWIYLGIFLAIVAAFIIFICIEVNMNH
jgi:hypothetical protein